jgi:hypothetical protein
MKSFNLVLRIFKGVPPTSLVSHRFAYLIHGHQVNQVIDRVLLKFSAMDGCELQILGFNSCGVSMWVSDGDCCQLFHHFSASSSRALGMQYTIFHSHCPDSSWGFPRPILSQRSRVMVFGFSIKLEFFSGSTKQETRRLISYTFIAAVVRMSCLITITMPFIQQRVKCCALPMNVRG